ncbi:MAG TPA: phosphopyruvate hydratase [Streptosporangiaceae bacterium]|nr:phosphopyruvate hydratase [Streptosporangiaceae bacterium]
MPDILHRITEITALEILDSRGRPTLQVSVQLASGARGRAAVPSGASTGSREAAELRDGDQHRFAGLGVQNAVASVRGEISSQLTGAWWPSLAQIDAAMIELDGTPGKSRLGANAILGVSMACARALAEAAGMQLWQWLTPRGVLPRLPVPHFNVVNGGVHAPNDLDFQEFMIAPLGAGSLPAAIQAGAEVYGVLRSLLAGKGYATGLGDEGGFAPQISEPEEVLELLVTAISDAGYEPGRDGIAIALDPAASEFRRRPGWYEVGSTMLSSAQMIERYAEIVERFPVWLIEDGLAEDDWEGWAELTARLGDRVQLVGDDIFVTSPAIIAEAIGKGIGNAALIKLNQVGTVTETLQAIATCRHGKYAQLISHRSGETTDTFIADLAVSSGCGELKAGAPARGERVAKYNRLLEIAAAQPDMPFGTPPA